MDNTKTNPQDFETLLSILIYKVNDINTKINDIEKRLRAMEKFYYGLIAIISVLSFTIGIFSKLLF
jgi:hypothetical protein